MDKANGLSDKQTRLGQLQFGLCESLCCLDGLHRGHWGERERGMEEEWRKEEEEHEQRSGV